jgi:hypothetical protein
MTDPAITRMWSFRTLDGIEVATYSGDLAKLAEACDETARVLGCALVAVDVV